LLAFTFPLLTGASAAHKMSRPPMGSKGPPLDSSRRVIVRFSDPSGERDDGELLRERTQELLARPGVVHTRALGRVGMVIAECESPEVEERLVRELEDDPQVELATPDTWVHFDGAAKGVAAKEEWHQQPEMPFQDLRKCSAQSGCAALGLVGQCCPAMDGMMLACCDGSATQNRVAIRSFHGKFMVAEENGAVNADRSTVDAWETFEIFHNTDGTISLRTHFGHYVAADEHGGVNAPSKLIGNKEKFKMIQNKDASVSFKTSFGKYMVAEKDGRLNANRDEVGDWEKFVMRFLGSAKQRFPNDANFSALWGMHEVKDNDIDAPEAWRKFTGEFSSGIIVAVIDTGIDYTHEDLHDNMWVNPGEIPDNGVDDDGNGFVDDVHGADFANEDGDPMDDQKHGTHCAGTIAGIGNNGIGVTGVSWHGVQLMALKFLTNTGGGKTSDAVRAIDYAIAHGAKVLSNSWGGGGSSAALRVAIERAAASGVLFTAAAGNSNTDNDESPHYPSNYGAENIVAVASTTSKGELSGFSCYGEKTVDLAAPGSRIYSTVPNSKYQFLSGTSMATPHVTGLAALVWMYRPALSMQQVKEVLMTSVEHSDALRGKCITGGQINARSALEVASLLEPPYPPVNAPRAVAFKDVNPKVGLIGGIVSITRAADEADVEYYRVYFVSRAGYQLGSLGTVNATGAEVLELPIGAPRSMPQYAAGIVAVAGNATGEMPAQIGGKAPNVTVEDFVVPEGGPMAVKWEGDVDLRTGMVAGKLVVSRAADEASITHYNVYWSSASHMRGQHLGSIPASGYMMPKCTGPTCSQINVSAIDGGRVFSRDDYEDNENAIIKASGPATIKVTRFETESYYDVLRLGSQSLSGVPPIPTKVELPEGPLTITWFSDDSIHGGGWAFELSQMGATAEFQVKATVPQGPGLEVVPAYGKNELLEAGVFVEVADYDSKMPPSPGFAPASLNFVDLDNSTGVIAGVVEVIPAHGAPAGTITYYQLDFADATGKPLGATPLGPRTHTNGNRSVLIPVATIGLPVGASKLVVRAGNNFGLSSGWTCTDIVDVLGSTPMALHVSHVAALGAGKLGDVHVQLHDVTMEESGEPWLLLSSSKQERRVVWTRADAGLLSAEAWRFGDHLMSSVTFSGVDSRSMFGSPFRKAFAEAVQAQLPFVGVEGVTITRILEVASKSGASPSGSSKGGAPVAATVEFRLRPPAGVPARAVDQIESRMILLSIGGSGAERFNRELFERLAAAGVRLPAGARSRVGAPQQVASRRRSGRSLAAALPTEAVSARRVTAFASQKGEDEGLLLAAAIAAFMAACAVALAVALVRRRRGSLLTRKEGVSLTACDGIHVPSDSREPSADKSFTS